MTGHAIGDLRYDWHPSAAVLFNTLTISALYTYDEFG